LITGLSPINFTSMAQRFKGSEFKGSEFRGSGFADEIGIQGYLSACMSYADKSFVNLN